MLKLTNKQISFIIDLSLVFAFVLFHITNTAHFKDDAYKITQAAAKPIDSKQLEKTSGAKMKPDQTTLQDVSGKLQPLKLSQVQSVPILYYHSIAVRLGNEVCMSPNKFQQQMTYLSEHGYHVISMDELYQGLYNSKPFPSKPVVITFDDGYSDNFTNAYPIMQKYGFAATVFVISSYINESAALSAEQLKKLQNARWIIGEHTENHTDLTKLSSTQVVAELQRSRKAIEAITGKPLNYFAYPYGEYNTQVMNEVQKVGYSLAFTTDRGWVSKKSNPLAMHRVYCYASMSMDEFVRRVSNPNY
jgi:peptidoglycan/xylan/chitin deacetylase (PgdA/CDA1 family)